MNSDTAPGKKTEVSSGLFDGEIDKNDNAFTNHNLSSSFKKFSIHEVEQKFKKVRIEIFKR
jgi:hypothetical protein